MTAFYGTTEMADKLKEWYDGYQFWHTGVYNPWSAINCVRGVATGGTSLPSPYWSNTSSNSIVRELVMRALS